MKITDFIKSNEHYFEDFITRSTYHSNAIEGNTLSYAETYAILFNDNNFSITATAREIYEAINHKYALSYIIEHSDLPLSEKIIKDIAININKNILDISGYRKTQVFIRGAEHIPPAPNVLNQTMMYFVHNYNNTKYQSIYEKIAVNHIELEKIHPFNDGNGRTGRLIVNLELLKNNLPPIVIPKEDRTLYFKLISNGNSDELSKYFKILSEKELKRIALFPKSAEQEPSLPNPLDTLDTIEAYEAEIARIRAEKQKLPTVADTPQRNEKPKSNNHER
ncbi:MAG: Fic family protein [Oscillospiraceae bacterium]